MSTITTTKRRKVLPGRLTFDAESKLRQAIETLLNAAMESEVGTALCVESLHLANSLQAYISAYRG